MFGALAVVFWAPDVVRLQMFLVSLGEVVHEHGDREGLVPQKEL